jgi:histidinol phosphatase-like enzyme
LLDEGIDVWRPVEAEKLASDRYLIVDQDYDRDLEWWEFEPGTVVRCRKEQRDGRCFLVATDAARRAVAG